MQNGNQSLVCPGERLGHTDTFESGEGTYILGNYVHASVIGAREETAGKDGGKTLLSVKKEKEPSIVPDIKSIVTARVTRVNPRFVNVSILCVGDRVLREPFAGMIRQQDVRATEIDKVEIYKCFRPGDIVLAEVISLGDSRSYFLSTAKNELGVIFAKSVAGATMVPTSWESMMCPKTKTKEFRKVAKGASLSSSINVNCTTVTLLQTKTDLLNTTQCLRR
ncbi:hypothetical protein PROFUN_01510 [Planoprotostelium fungivorum]|uniref:Uncharacterized protein n=1 Tax=Planoprotostelium fungivorum TaxID=1890364 RepID=A0A2P6NTR0_9EUKA|nr:hypothetical protein PROFUN_01510 [Planoprotostelium fungivorum]